MVTDIINPKTTSTAITPVPKLNGVVVDEFFPEIGDRNIKKRLMTIITDQTAAIFVVFFITIQTYLLFCQILKHTF
jgi:hypothetical protein